MKKQRGNQSDKKSFVKETKGTSGNLGSKAVSGKPADSNPAVGNPAVSKPAVSKPAVSKPAVSKPAVSKPAVSKPLSSMPAVSKPVKSLEVAGIKKQYLKSRSVCKVTFKLPNEAAPDAQKVSIVGDFNNWDGGAAVMKRLKNGDFTIIMELETGREYCYRYLIDATKWENDWCADRYRPNPFGCDDSVIIL